MANLPSLAVTGSTGALGGAVAAILAAAGVPQRLLVRTVAKAPKLKGAVALPFSYSDRAASAKALAGVETLFMVSAAESVERVDQHRAFIDSAKGAGVKHIVYTSFVGASPEATFTLARDHYLTEEYIKGTGIVHTFLRDNLYLDFTADLVGEDGVIRGPAGDGKVAMVARRDVARTAAAVLQNPEAHAKLTYDLTGPEALTMAEIAAVLSKAIQHRVTFENETIEQAYASRKQLGAPEWQNEAWVSTYTAIAAGELENVSSDIATVTGQPPLGLAAFLAAET